jgi:pyridoxal phosphate enzyme (YggS family)
MTWTGLSIGESLVRLQEKISQAAHRAGRRADEITLCAVTKNVSPATVAEAWKTGVTLFGESRVQEAEAKIPVVSPARDATNRPQWDLIGHLQTNKARRAVEIFDRIQSVDNPRVAHALNDACARKGKMLPCLVEINMARDPAKHGLLPEDAESFLDRMEGWRNLVWQGLMTVAPHHPNPEDSRPVFSALRELADRHRRRWAGKGPVLSMGMSHDFEAAVAEGATLVRVGAALFGERPAP